MSLIFSQSLVRPIKKLSKLTILERERVNENDIVYPVRNDEIGTLSKSLDDMTHDLYKRINIAENFSRDLVHEIRNPLASLKSASEIISETENIDQRNKLRQGEKENSTN